MLRRSETDFDMKKFSEPFRPSQKNIRQLQADIFIKQKLQKPFLADEQTTVQMMLLQTALGNLQPLDQPTISRSVQNYVEKEMLNSELESSKVYHKCLNQPKLEKGWKSKVEKRELRIGQGIMPIVSEKEEKMQRFMRAFKKGWIAKIQ